MGAFIGNEQAKEPVAPSSENDLSYKRSDRYTPTSISIYPIQYIDILHPVCDERHRRA